MQFKAETDPALLLPQLLDYLIALGDMAQQISHAFGGNGHRPEAARLTKRIWTVQDLVELTD